MIGGSGRGRKMVSFEAFAGAGGAALGVHQAGFTCEWAAEMDKHASATFRAAFPSVPVVVGKLGRTDAETPESWASVDDAVARLKAQNVEVDLVCGGPSCVSFSTAGLGLGEDDDRDCFPAAIKLIDKVRPRSFIYENVKGLTTKKHRAYLDRVVSMLQALGYVVGWRVLDASDFGVPQRRHRVFIVGIRRDVAAAAVEAEVRFKWPEQTHSIEALVTSKWILGDYWREHGLRGPVATQMVSHGNSAHVASGKLAPGTVDDPAYTQRAGGGGPSNDLVPLPTGSDPDPKHPPADLDGAAGSIRSGGSGHDAPPVYVSGLGDGYDHLATPITSGGAGYSQSEKELSMDGPTQAIAASHRESYIQGIAKPSTAESRVLRLLSGVGKAADVERTRERAGLLRWRTVRDALAGTVEMQANGYVNLIERTVAGATRHSPSVVSGVSTDAKLVDIGHDGERKGGSRSKSVLYKPSLPDAPSATVSTAAERGGSEHALRVATTTRTDHGVAAFDRPSPVLKAGGNYDAFGHMGGAVPPSIPIEDVVERDDSTALSPHVLNRIASGEVDHILRKHPPRRMDEPSNAVESNLAKQGYYGTVQLDASPANRTAPQYGRTAAADEPSTTVDAGGGPSTGTRPPQVRIRNLGAGDGQGAGEDEPSPTVPAGQDGQRGLAFVDGATAHEWVGGAGTSEPGRVHSRPAVTLRRLSPSECARLQAFPDDWPWQGPRTAQFRCIGNAAPAPLVRAVALSVRAILDAVDSAAVAESQIDDALDLDSAPVEVEVESDVVEL